MSDHFLRADIAMVAANDAASDTAPIAWQAGSSLVQASLKQPRHLAMLGVRKVSHHANSDLQDPVGIEDRVYDDVNVAPRSHKLMISALHISARMAVSGG